MPKVPLMGGNELSLVSPQINVSLRLPNRLGGYCWLQIVYIGSLRDVPSLLVSKDHICLPQKIAIDLSLLLSLVVLQILVVFFVVHAREVRKGIPEVMVVLSKTCEFLLLVHCWWFGALFVVVVGVG